MAYHAYDKILDSTSQWQLDHATQRAIKNTQFIVTEKIHGACFCMLTDGERVWSAKRRGLLQADDDGDGFFHFASIVREHEDAVKNAHSLVRQHLGSSAPSMVVQVFGELFGGGYPHPDVPVDAHVQLVQTGIYYHPSVRFCAFDIGYSYLQDGSDFTYLDFTVSQQIFQTTGIFHNQPLFRGTLEAALEYDVNFASTIPARLGMPPLIDYANWAEGVVVRSAAEIRVPYKRGFVRAIVKKKAKRFSEEHAVYESATRWDSARDARGDATEAQQLELLTLEIQALATPNRVQNAISKLGPVEHDQKERVKELLAMTKQDVTEEIEQRCADELAALRGGIERLQSVLEHECKSAIIEFFKQRAAERRRLARAASSTSSSNSSTTTTATTGTSSST